MPSFEKAKFSHIPLLLVTEDPLHLLYQHHQTMKPFNSPLDDFNFNFSYPGMYSPHAPFDPETLRALMDPQVQAAPTIMERPVKKPKTEIWSNTGSPEAYKAPRSVMSSPLSNPQLISFGSSGLSSTETQQIYGAYEIHDCQNEIHDCQKEKKRVGAMSRPTLHTQEHVIAERKRRQKLSQCFIALSAIIPGLKKMDKASILGDAIKHMKQLQERVKKLEEEVATRTVESIVIVRKSQVLTDDDTSSLNKNSYIQFEQPLPEIEAKVLDKYVLFWIHYQKRKGYMIEILSEIEKFNLVVLNSNVLPFGSSMLNMTIVTQMEVGFCMKVEDLVKNLRQALLKME